MVLVFFLHHLLLPHLSLFLTSGYLCLESNLLSLRFLFFVYMVVRDELVLGGAWLRSSLSSPCALLHSVYSLTNSIVSHMEIFYYCFAGWCLLGIISLCRAYINQVPVYPCCGCSSILLSSLFTCVLLVSSLFLTYVLFYLSYEFCALNLIMPCIHQSGTYS
jgi:hypothetical protein